MVARSLLVLLAALALSTAVSAAEPQAPAPPSDQRRAQPETERLSPRPRVGPVMSNRCYTVAANCILSDSQPRDSKCWCATPFGPSYGTAR
ncbi:MAG TPA: hypothetical protein VHP37_13800 [Burkholderiales bacterium]|nr:hypothetical protein [Burkholderiales bacterium]